jgi:hypothetical protein
MVARRKVAGEKFAILLPCLLFQPQNFSGALYTAFGHKMNNLD